MPIKDAYAVAGVRTTIGSLAFAAPEQEDAVKLGVLAGSLASGILGFALLRLCGKAPGDAGAQETSPS